MDAARTVECGIAILIVTLVPAHGIRCFQCNSAEDAACAALTHNDTTSIHYRNCSGPQVGVEFFCRKTWQKVLDTRQERVIRACGWIVHRERRPNCRRSDTDFKYEESCQCFADGCNLAPRSRPLGPAAALALVLLLLGVGEHFSRRLCPR